MSGIYGLIALDGRALAPDSLDPMRAEMARWERTDTRVWADGAAALGQALRHDTPESVGERMPVWRPEERVAFTAQGRIDNRDDLFAALGVPGADRAGMPDGDLMLRAYLRWGEDTPPHLLGDWSFAAWHPAFRRLVLARDHHGVTALHLWRDAATIAFASSLTAVLALPAVPRRIDELRLAQVLVSWPGDGVQTAYEGIEAVPPAHLIVIGPGREERRRYWTPSARREWRRRSSEDYVEGLRLVLDQAVRARLRSVRPVASMLSGGLDSGSVASLAARALAARGERLRAYCAVPAFPDRVALVGPARFGDEWARASATAAHAGTVDLVRLDSACVSPVACLHRALDVLAEPQHAASNLYWILDLLDAASGHGAGALLTGQGGNGTISWKGRAWIRPGRAAEDARDWRRRLRHQVLPHLVPDPLARHLSRRALLGRTWAATAIAPAFARRLRLAERWADALEADRAFGLQLQRDPARMRLAVIQPGRSGVGAFWHQAGAAFGIDVGDPTSDPRVIEFCLSVPMREFTGPRGADRWLVRRAMRGILPAEVLDTERRGLQAADIGARLNAHAAEVDAALDRIDRSALVHEYLNVSALGAAWQSIQADPAGPGTYVSAVTVLLRGLMCGLWVVRMGESG